MSKPPKKNSGRDLAKLAKPKAPAQTDFDTVLGLIDAARTRAVAAVNTTLIELYWSIGEYLLQKISLDGWGKGTVEDLSVTIQRRFPGVTGYSAQNLWRMRQFFETYRASPILSTLLRELSWSHNLAIMSRCKRDEEREFYLRLAIRERWTIRELQRQLAGWIGRKAQRRSQTSRMLPNEYLSMSSVFS